MVRKRLSKVDKGKLKLKFLQSDDIERVVSPVVN